MNDPSAVPGQSRDPCQDNPDLQGQSYDMGRSGGVCGIQRDRPSVQRHDSPPPLSPIDAEILAAAKAFIQAKEAGLNTNHRYRRLRRAWSVSVRSQ